MRPLLLHGFGTSLRVSGHVLEVTNGAEGRRETFAAHQLPFDSVVVEGNSGTLSFEAARFLAVRDVPVTFLRWDGSVLSTLLPRGPVAGELKLGQFASHNGRRRRSEVARAILGVKLSKSVELLRFLSRFYPCDPKAVAVEVSRGPTEESIRGLMGWEGRTAAVYWEEFAKIVNRLWPEARFVTRKGKGRSWAQSATDPVNALLNFGYALLEGRVRQAVNSVGLEPSVGWLHETAASKLPVVYDLQEPFRWLVDLSVIETIAGRQLDRKGDFITTENYHVRLRPRAIGLLAARLSENFNRAVPFRGQRRTFDALLFETTRNLARYLLDESKGLSLDYPFGAFDGVLDNDAAETVSALTYADARRLGISKAGLFYMKRRAAEGKPLRLYEKVARKLPAVGAQH
ncbi:MAG: CRISPR-associated endonuclease Cas1 [Nitrososphaerales archaeon]